VSTEWKFEYEQKKSITNPDSNILKIKNLEKKKRYERKDNFNN
jgi:hypothetical protein